MKNGEKSFSRWIFGIEYRKKLEPNLNRRIPKDKEGICVIDRSFPTNTHGRRFFIARGQTVALFFPLISETEKGFFIDQGFNLKIPRSEAIRPLTYGAKPSIPHHNTATA